MSDKPNDARDERDLDGMQRDIRASQARITDTLDTLKRRLDPRHLMEQTMNRTDNRMGNDRSRNPRSGDYRQQDGRQQDSSYGSAMTHRLSSGASSMGDMVRGNPVPMAMIGLGVGWLLLSRTGYDHRLVDNRYVHGVRDGAGSAARYARDTFYSAADRVRHTASDAYDAASNAVGNMTERAGDAYSSAYEGARGMARANTGGGGRQAAQSSGPGMVSRATHSLWDMVEDHPLVAGVMGVALGAAIGASIPSTRYENRWVGDYADQVTDRAKELAQDAVERGARAARAAAEAAREHVTEAASDVQNAARDEINRSS
ncbi:DUF3618 domain-containing protein [Azospirillum sp.]|uniref:DUF3618 domain-containing protein n=1 Tax=Azospirillum sp. TaxID=34012 RepID=UPI002D33F123|nr:DUF3618 domain-containing protein [Azospirillum sp.]HYD70931.1 DUF3618 domain-containing protein [Azospirillum sp.]